MECDEARGKDMKEQILLEIIVDQISAIQNLATEIEFLKHAISETPLLQQRYEEATKHRPFSVTLDLVRSLRQRVVAIKDQLQ